jgi:exodeoxyribonuclease VIII
MKPLNTGDKRIIHDMPDAEYRAVPAVAASDIGHILPPKTPAHYAAHMAGELRREQSRAMLIGTLCHLAVLEPEKLDAAFVAKPEGIDYRTKEGKAWKADAGDLPILDADEVRAVNGIRDSIAAHPGCCDLLAGCKSEVSIFTPHDSGLWLKGRVDALADDGTTIVDVKTTSVGASAGAFGRQAFNLHYHVKAAHYMHLAREQGLNCGFFYWLAVEVTPPFAVAIYTPSDAMLEAGARAWAEALATIAGCEARGEWPGYGQDAVTLDLPAWAYRMEGAE